jgi:hypothetical protein
MFLYVSENLMWIVFLLHVTTQFIFNLPTQCRVSQKRQQIKMVASTRATTSPTTWLCYSKSKLNYFVCCAAKLPGAKNEKFP